MTANLLIEAFGGIVSEDIRSDDVSLEDALVAGLQRVNQFADLEDVETIYTGMNADVTYAIEDAIDALNVDIDVRAFYPNVNRIMDEDDVEYNEAWKRGYTWRNNQLFVEDSDDEDRETVDLTVRLGDAGNNGQALLSHSRTKGVPALDINLDDLIDRDAAYGDGEAEADVPEPDKAAA